MNVGVDAGMVGLIRCPVNVSPVVIGKKHRPLRLGKKTRPLAQSALFIDITFVTTLTVGICASIHRVGEHSMDGGIRCGNPANRTVHVGAKRKAEAFGTKPQPYLARRSQLGELREHRTDGTDPRRHRDRSTPRRPPRPTRSPQANHGATRRVPPCCGSRPPAVRARYEVLLPTWCLLNNEQTAPYVAFCGCAVTITSERNSSCGQSGRVKRIFWRGGPRVLVRLQSGVLRAFTWEETDLPMPPVSSPVRAVPVLLSPQALLDLIRFLRHREGR